MLLSLIFVLWLNHFIEFHTNCQQCLSAKMSSSYTKVAFLLLFHFLSYFRNVWLDHNSVDRLSVSWGCCNADTKVTFLQSQKNIKKILEKGQPWPEC